MCEDFLKQVRRYSEFNAQGNLVHETPSRDEPVLRNLHVYI